MGPPKVFTWEVYEGRNCWWNGHGAEEVDMPQGSAVSGVTIIEDCKESCISVSNDLCEGILFQKSTTKCFRKTSIIVTRCSRDSDFTLYLRTDPNRPPSAPYVQPAGMMTSETCSAAMRDRNHRFYTIWGDQGWRVRRPGEPACWGDGGWFDWVAGTHNCNQNWGRNLRAPTVFGFKESMEAYCNEAAGNGWHENGNLQGACWDAHLNILRTGSWNMCRNAEWMICIIQQAGAGGDGSIIFSFAPSELDMTDYAYSQWGYAENDIYYLEVCTLNEMCSNYEEIFMLKVGDKFHCKFDPVRWANYGREMRILG